jgi:multidrug efflux pump subunit AcrA (membrane-fusion protein)
MASSPPSAAAGVDVMAANDRCIAAAKAEVLRAEKRLKTSKVAQRLAEESLKVAQWQVDEAQKGYAAAAAALEAAEEHTKAASRKWEVVDLTGEGDDRPWYRSF